MPNPTVPIDVEAVLGKFNAMTSEYLVELPGIEPGGDLQKYRLSCVDVRETTTDYAKAPRITPGLLAAPTH